MAIDLGWTLASRAFPEQRWWITLAGGFGLCALGIFYGAARLGLGRDRPALRLLGALALAAVLLMPAAVRWTGAPALGGAIALTVVVVSAGQEIAFRGVVFTALRDVGGDGLAVIGSTLAFTAVHLFSHPPGFLPAVFFAGLLLGLWRWACRDLVGPVIAHVLANLAL